MKRLTHIVGALGLLVLIGLVAREGARDVITLLAQAGAALLWLVPLHALSLLLDVLGWRSLLAGRPRAAPIGLGSLFMIASVREAVNRLLPVANVGGEILGIRLAALRGVDGALAAASVIVEVLLTLVSQYLFVVLGLLCLLRLAVAPEWVRPVLLTLAIAFPLIAALALLLRYGAIFERLGKLIESMLGRDSGSRRLLLQSSQLDEEIRRLYRARARLLATVTWQFAALLLGSLENLLVLRWFGAPIGIAQALALESLTQTVRHFVFLVPAGLGVQEAGLVALGAVLGLSAPTALALSLAKRMREILFGLPWLLAWQWFEARRASPVPAVDDAEPKPQRPR